MMASNVISRPPVAHANRGRWFEQAIEETNHIYRARGIGWITQHRAPSTIVVGKDSTPRRIGHRGPVDFSGVLYGIPVAFDAKSTSDPRLSAHHVTMHQLDELQGWERAGGIGFFLVSFRAEAFFVASATWYWRALGTKGSVSRRRFEQDSEEEGQGVVRVLPGTVPIDYAPAVFGLAGRSRPSARSTSA